MAHNYEQLAEELRKRIDNPFRNYNIEVTKDSDFGGIWITAEHGAIIHFMEVADFCRYHGLSVYAGQKYINEGGRLKKTAAIRIY